MTVFIAVIGCSGPSGTPDAGGSASSSAGDRYSIRLGPAAAVPATLTSNVSVTRFRIGGIVGSANEFVLPATSVAKIVLPMGEATITATVKCYPKIVNHIQVGLRDDELDINFVFSNAMRKPDCEDEAQQPAILPVTPAAPAAATEKLAWVIANSAYTDGWPALSFVEDDKTNMVALLSRAGFRVITSYNIPRRQLLADEDTFARLLAERPWRAVVVYMSGHGVGLQGRNYFVPVDAPNAKAPVAQDLLAIADVQQILRKSVSRGSFGIVLVDACRSAAGGEGHRMVAADDHDVLVNYSTSPGSTSYDNPGGMSGWTQRFVSVSNAYPGLGIDQLVLYADRYTTWQSAASLRVQTPVLYGRFPPTVPRFGWQQAMAIGTEVPVLQQVGP
ncbi:MAG TPA: caspase family protein [Rhodopila sp.]